MNREQRRALTKRLKAKCVKNAKALVENYDKAEKIRKNGTGEHTPPQELDEGEPVMLNVEAIKARDNYVNMSASYQKFVEENGDKVFTAHIDDDGIVTFVEDSTWLFWSGDLIKVSTDNKNAENSFDSTMVIDSNPSR